MEKSNLPRMIRFFSMSILLSLVLIMATQGSMPASAAPSGPTAALTVANVSTPDINCLFDNECTIFVEDTTSSFTFDMMTGAGFLQSQLWPRGDAETIGAGLFPYLYRLDMRELIGPGNPGCVSSYSFDFGPIVPLDYDNDGSLEDAFVITSGSLGSVNPSSVDLTGDELTISFSPPVCGDFSPSQDNGESSFFLGLTSPFRDREVEAEVNHNWGEDPLELIVRAPQYVAEPSLIVVPSNGTAGETVQLIGSGYTPGGYPGTIRWNGSDDTTLDIPNGGAFSEPYTIPTEALIADHTITVCSLNPCATGEFEQLASAPFAVNGIHISHQIFLPAVIKAGLTEAEPFSYVIDSSVTPWQDELPGTGWRHATAVDCCP